MIVGTVYGVVLNDSAERAGLTKQFAEPPYKAPPAAPVIYIKPRNCIASHGAPVALPAGLAAVQAAATLGILFGRDAAKASESDAASCIAGICLALDITEAHRSYFRPAIRQRCRDTFLPVGAIVPFDASVFSGEIHTEIDGKAAHSWALSRLVRNPARLIADISAFMTLSAGDLLLIGLPHDAPSIGLNQKISVSAAGLPTLSTSIVTEHLQ